jgi:hypothetical protein
MRTCYHCIYQIDNRCIVILCVIFFAFHFIFIKVQAIKLIPESFRCISNLNLNSLIVKQISTPGTSMSVNI